MRSKALIAILLLFTLSFLTGCQSTYLVHDATVAKITPIVKDYAGMHGYTITYSNDKTGSYGLDMGAVYVPYTSSSSRTSTVTQIPASSGQPMTAYEETTWNTVASAGHYVEAAATIRVLQQGSDVLVLVDTNDAGGSSLNDLHNYIQQLGFIVDNK